MNQDRLQAALDRVREAVFDDHFEARVACMEIHRALQELHAVLVHGFGPGEEPAPAEGTASEG